MNAFAVVLVPSKIRRVAVCLFALLVCICVWRYFSGSLNWLLQTATLSATAYALHEPHRQIRRITINPKQQAELVFDEQHTEPAELLSGSLISPFFISLKWRCGGKTVRQTLLPDMTDAESWRRLTVWARFCRSGREQI